MDKRAKRIGEAIIASGLSYRELSEKTGISRSMLQEYATGNTEKIPADRLFAIAEATNVSPTFLMCMDANAMPTPVDSELLKELSMLNVEQQKIIRALIKTMIPNN